MKSKKLVLGIGVNDAEYIIQPVINGKQVLCPFYQRWMSMLTRCYSDKFKKIRPTYTGCSVSKEWLTFSNFKNWMVKQDWQGKDLDKDLLIQGNKVYSSESCLFVASEINKLLGDHKAKRGLFPIGVHFYKTTNKYQSKIKINGKTKSLGYFHTAKEAFEVYKKFKYKLIADIANKQAEPLKSALLNYKIGE